MKTQSTESRHLLEPEKTHTSSEFIIIVWVSGRAFVWPPALQL